MDELKGTQVLYLWALLAQGGEGFICDQPVELKKPERLALERAGLVEGSQRKRPQTGRRAGYHVLTDRGWSWAVDHLRDPIDSRSTRAAAVLGLMLARLDDFLRQRSLVLADFITSEPLRTPDLVARIRETCLDLGLGKPGRRIRLAHLRDVLGDVPRAELDDTLAQLQAEGTLLLYPLDDPQERTPADEAAAINLAGVGKRHLLILER